MTGLWSVALGACLEAFAALGLDPAEICRECGIEAAVLDDADARIPVELSGRIWTVAAAEYGPAIGLGAGLAVPFGALQSLDYVMVTADTVECAVRSIARYFVLMTGGLTAMSVERERGGGLRVTFSGPVSLLIRDYALSALASRVRRVGADVPRFCFAGPPVALPSDYERLLQGQVRFHRPTSHFEVTCDSLSRPIARAYPGLRSVVLREVERLVASLDGDSELTRVRNIAAALLPAGPPRLGDVALRLHTSPRTLQRRLRSRGIDFTGLVDELRANLARTHLDNRALSVAEVGYLCGYADPSSFNRAFVRWHGRPPAAFRAGRL